MGPLIVFDWYTLCSLFLQAVSIGDAKERHKPCFFIHNQLGQLPAFDIYPILHYLQLNTSSVIILNHAASFSSIEEALIGVLSSTVDPVSVPAYWRYSCPIIDTHLASSRGGGSGPGMSQSTKEEEEDGGEPLEWNVIVWVLDNEGINRKEIGVSSLTDQDLCKLKTEDPFLYYSILSIRCKSYLCDDGKDGNAIKKLMTRQSSPPADFRRQGALYNDVPENTRRRESIVRRNMRLSTVAHLSLIFEEMMLQELQELDDDNTDDNDNMDDVFEQWLSEFKDP